MQQNPRLIPNANPPGQVIMDVGVLGLLLLLLSSARARDHVHVHGGDIPLPQLLRLLQRPLAGL